MIKYVKQSQIDKIKWDECVAKSLNATFFALSAVLDITSPNWDALVYDDYVGVFPLPWRKKWGQKYIYPPYFSTQLGLYSPQILDIEPFFKAIPKEFTYIEIRSNTFFKTSEDVPILQKNRTYYLTLDKSLELLTKNFSKNHIQNIKKANKESLTLTKTGNSEDIIQLFINNKGNIYSFKPVDYTILHQLIIYMNSQGKVTILSVYDETNTLCAGAFFVHSFGKIHFLFSGSNVIAKEKKAMFFLFNEFLKEHCTSNSILDFGGSNDDNLARFYKGFGSSDFYYDTIAIDHSPKIVKLGRKIVQIARKK